MLASQELKLKIASRRIRAIQLITEKSSKNLSKLALLRRSNSTCLSLRHKWASAVETHKVPVNPVALQNQRDQPTRLLVKKVDLLKNLRAIRTVWKHYLSQHRFDNSAKWQRAPQPLQVIKMIRMTIAPLF